MTNRVAGAFAAMVCAAGLSAAAFAAPTAAGQIEMQLGSVTLKMPVPAGYCPPAEEQLPGAEANARLDSRNHTMATLLACNRQPEVQPWSNYILIKSPYGLIDQSIGKEFGLAMIDKGLSGPNRPVLDSAMSKEAGRATERELGVKVEIQGTYGYAGRDGDCVYLAGPMQAEVQGKMVHSQAATCITVSAGKMFSVSVYRFSERKTIADIPAMKAEARKVALSVRP